MGRKNHIIGLTVVALLALMSSCYHDGAFKKYGMPLNEQREVLGVSLLDSTWTYNEYIGALGASWINPQYEFGVPCHFEKKISCDTNGIVSESDIFYGTDVFKTCDATFQEGVFIEYYYKTKQWTYTWERRGEKLGQFYLYEDVDITKEEADSLLHLWGLKYHS